MVEFRTISVRVHPVAHQMYRKVAEYHSSHGKKVWAWVEDMVAREYQRIIRLEEKEGKGHDRP